MAGLTSTFVSTAVPKLFTDSVIGAESVRKGIINFIPDNRTKKTLTRFTVANNLITAPVQKPTTAAGGWTQDEKVITSGEVELYDEIDPMTFIAGWPHTWPTDLTTRAALAGSLRDAIIPTYTRSFGNDTELAIWQGDTTSGSAWLAQYDGLIKLLDADATVVDITPAGAITTTNVITVLQAVLDGVSNDIFDNANLAIVTTPAVVRTYQAKQRLDGVDKGVRYNERGFSQHAGVQILSTQGMPANRIVCTVIGPDGNLKLAGWAAADETYVEIDKVQNNSRLHYIKMNAELGVNTVFGKYVTMYKPA